MPIPPKTPNHSTDSSVGAKVTPMMYSRMVRPRLIRAMNTPTKGAQAIHQMK